MTRSALVAFVLALTLPTLASAEEWVTVHNDGLSSSVQMEVVASHCVDGLSGLDNYTMAPDDSVQARPRTVAADDCSWDVLTQKSSWHIALYGVTAGEHGGRYLLGFVQGNGTNDVAWMPMGEDGLFLVVPIRDAVGSLNLFVQQARLTDAAKNQLAAR